MEGQSLHNVHTFLLLRGRDNQFEIANVLADRAAELVAKEQAGKRSVLPLPRLRQNHEADILGDDHATELTGSLEQFRLTSIAVLQALKSHHLYCAAWRDTKVVQIATRR